MVVHSLRLPDLVLLAIDRPRCQCVGARPAQAATCVLLIIPLFYNELTEGSALPADSME